MKYNTVSDYEAWYNAEISGNGSKILASNVVFRSIKETLGRGRTKSETFRKECRIFW
jgi:hypothetical protein